MLRPIFCATLVLATACASPPSIGAGRFASIAADVGAPLRDARLASHLGTWDGRSYIWGDDTVGVPWRLVHRPAGRGGVQSTLEWPNGRTEPVMLRAIHLTADRFVYEFGPFFSAMMGGEVKGRAEGRIVGQRMEGVFELRPLRGGNSLRGRFEGGRTSLASVTLPELGI
jgi:hypothetical protein